MNLWSSLPCPASHSKFPHGVWATFGQIWWTLTRSEVLSLCTKTIPFSDCSLDQLTRVDHASCHAATLFRSNWMLNRPSKHPGAMRQLKNVPNLMGLIVKGHKAIFQVVRLFERRKLQWNAYYNYNIWSPDIWDRWRPSDGRYVVNMYTAENQRQQ